MKVDVEIPGVCGRCGKSGIQKFMALTLVQGTCGEEPSGMLETYCAACHNLTVHIANYNGGIIMPLGRLKKVLESKMSVTLSGCAHF